MKKLLLVLSLVFIGAIGLFAVSCGAPTYSFSFETSGGAAIETVELQEGEEYTLPVPEREGYSFEGWYLTADFSGDPVTTITATGDTTFYAKWKQLSVITLDLNGGSLATGTTLYLAANEIIYDFMQSYVPEKTGFQFGTWYVGDNVLGRNERMPEEGITLRAEYMVGYTVEIWTQKVTLDGYEKTDEIGGYDYVGNIPEIDQNVQGFVRAEDAEGEKPVKALTENAAENLFSLYFDRADISVTFRPDYPDGSSGTDERTVVKYGTEIVLPTDYTFEGYFLIGWRAVDGTEYSLNYIDSIIYNGTGESEETTFVPTRDTAFSGIWSRGYTDMLGGDDYIFLFAEDAESVYLCRGGVYFKGDYYPEDREFDFIDETGTNAATMLTGKLNENGTFIYTQENSRRAYLYTGEENEEGLLYDQKHIMYFGPDGYDDVDYNILDEEGHVASSSSGIYTIDSNNVYHITFTEGELAGQELAVLLGSLSNQTVYMVRDEALADLGTMYRFFFGESSTSNPDGSPMYGVMYYTAAYTLSFDGFQTALYNNGSGTDAYYYVENDDGTITLYDPDSGATVLVVKLIDELANDGAHGYVVYSAGMARTFEADGAQLILDGTYNASYTAGGKTETGHYFATSNSVLGGVVITFVGTISTRVFIVDSETVGTGEDSETIINYIFTEKNIGYAEYRHLRDGVIYTAPLIVLDDAAAGAASLYGFNNDEQEYRLVSTGTYAYDEATGRYTYTADKFYEANVSVTLYDLIHLKSVVFGITSVMADSGASYSVTYWYSAVFEEDSSEQPQEYGQIFTEYNEDREIVGRLTLLNGYAILESAVSTDSGYVYIVLLEGAYSASEDNENLISIIYNESGTSAVCYLELDREENTFVSLSNAPYTATAVLEDNTVSNTETLTFDGKGGAVYTIEDVSYTGKVVRTEDTTRFGYYIYTFSAQEVTFNFIQTVVNSRYYFFKYNQNVPAGIYISDEAGTLILDGYAYAEYTDLDNNTYQGMYYISEPDAIAAGGDWELLLVLTTENGTFYFDCRNNALEEFTVRGREYGTYVYFDNQAIGDVYFRLDGYGGLEVFDLNTEDGGDDTEPVPVATGSYEMGEGSVVTLSYQDSLRPNPNVVLVGTLGVITAGNLRAAAFILQYEEFNCSFVNQSDWSVLVLDGYGNVTRYDEEGVSESGSYTLITDNLLYYANADGTSASLYTYSYADSVMSPVSLRQHAYYTEDLEALFFSEYGFAIFNGETRYYYTENEDGSVTLYYHDIGNSEANEFGFVVDEDTIQSFENNEITIADKTYYSNNGVTLTFERDDETASQYPVNVQNEDNETVPRTLERLTFTPSGASEFSVTGSILLSGMDNTLSCVVTREANEAGGYDMYITMATVGGLFSYRFDITVSYRGASSTESTYTVDGMSLRAQVQSESYYTLYMLAYMMYGPTVAAGLQNTFGTVTLRTDYNTEGVAGDPYIVCEFGENAGLFYSDGTPVTDINAAYESSGSSYMVNFKGSDGLDYTLQLYISLNSNVNAYSYRILGLIRMETLEDASSGITVTTGRLVASDMYESGSLYSVQIFRDGEEIAAESRRYIGEDLYVIVRNREETGDDTQGKILSSVFYKVELTEGAGETVGDENENVIPLYSAVKVTAENVGTYYTADGASYVDIRTDDNTVMLLTLGSTVLAVTESSYDEGTQTYTVTAANESSYTVKITDRVAEITELSE